MLRRKVKNEKVIPEMRSAFPPPIGMSGLLLWVWGFLLLSGFAGSVKIVELRVPQTVANGTLEPILLDCDYVLEDGEKKEEVVVKWFFNRSPSPVYQWIFGQKPRALGILRNRIDLSFIASEDDWAAHRALNIVRPTTELTGDWLCRVSTFQNDAMKAAKMIVFAPPKEMDISLVSKRGQQSINVSCWANGAFPEPRLTISYNSYQMQDVIMDVDWRGGAFDVTVHKMLEAEHLPAPLPVIFDCELKIPNTNFHHRKSLLYAGLPAELSSSHASPVSSPFSWALLLILLGLILRI